MKRLIICILAFSLVICLVLTLPPRSFSQSSAAKKLRQASGTQDPCPDLETQTLIDDISKLDKLEPAQKQYYIDELIKSCRRNHAIADNIYDVGVDPRAFPEGVKDTIHPTRPDTGRDLGNLKTGSKDIDSKSIPSPQRK